MSEQRLNPKTAVLLADPLLGEGDVDSKVLRLLASEYARRLAAAQAIDQQLAQKYQTTFADFLERRTTVQHESSWEVEKDALDWENAAGTIPTLARNLQEIEELLHAADQ